MCPLHPIRQQYARSGLESVPCCHHWVGSVMVDTLCQVYRKLDMLAHKLRVSDSILFVIEGHWFRKQFSMEIVMNNWYYFIAAIAVFPPRWTIMVGINQDKSTQDNDTVFLGYFDSDHWLIAVNTNWQDFHPGRTIRTISIGHTLWWPTLEPLIRTQVWVLYKCMGFWYNRILLN